MAGLSSPGLGSGLDINGLITKLMAVEQLPLQTLAKQEASYQAKLTAYGTLKGYLSSFQTAVRGLTTVANFTSLKATSSDTTVFTASASTGAATGNYSIGVTTLAQNQKLRSGTVYGATSASVGTGTLTIDFGTYTGGTFTQNAAKGTKTITIGATQNTLSGVRDAINAANAGVAATIVNDGTGYRLMLTSTDSGSNNALRIVAGSGISALAYDASTGGTSNMVQTQAAQDATLTIDGIAVTKSSNTITDAIEGVSLSLLKSGSSSTLAVSRDTSGIRSSVEGFVKAYNDAAKSLKDLTAYDANTKKGAVLLGDATTLSVQSQLRRVLNTSLPYASGGLKTLSDIGVSFRKEGSLSLDYTKLDTVLADATKDVATLFAAVGKPSDGLVKFSTSSSDTQPGSYALRVKQIATQGTLTGSAMQGAVTTIDSTHNGLDLTVNGVAASITLSNGSYSNAALLASVQAAINGNTTLSSGGITVTASMNGTQAAASGSTTTGLTIGAANKTFDITVDSNVATVTLDEGTYTAASLASHVQAKINAALTALPSTASVSVTQSNGVLTVKSDRYGASSNLSFAASAATTNLFGGTPAAGTGTGTSTIALTSDQYGSVSNVNVTGGTSALTLFGAATVSGTPGKTAAGTIFNTSGVTHGYATGSATLSGTQTVNGGNNALSITVDNVTANVTLDAASYTVAELAAHIQSKINADSGFAAAGISVAVVADSSTGKLTITSDNYGTSSSVTALGGTAATAFIGTAASTDGTGTVADAAHGNATGSIGLVDGLEVTSSNNTLSLIVDGTGIDITIATNASYTVADLAAEIQNKINADSGLAVAGKRVKVLPDIDGKLVITSQAYGPSSTVAITGGTAVTGFLGTATSTAGTGTATGFGRYLTAVNGDANGMKIEIGGGSIGARGTVAFDKGFSSRLDDAITNLLETDGTIVSRTDGIYRSLKDINSRREVINRRLVDIEARYRRQFNALDALVASMQQTSQYLSQQLAALTASTS